MKTIIENKIPISSKQLLDFFSQKAKIEKDKLNGQNKVKEQQLKNAIGDKKIIFSNKA